MTAFWFAFLLAVGMPVAFVLLASSFIFMAVTGNTRVLESVPQIIFSGLEVFDLLAIPLFILLGELMNAGGITGRLIAATKLLLGRLPHALAYVCLAANLMLASIMGSATAQIAVMTRVMVPEMEAEGYSRSFAAALTAAAGMLGPIIPPSMIFIIYGVVAQVSVADMFLAGILPGMLLFALLAALITLRTPKRNDDETVPAVGSPQETGLIGRHVLTEAGAGLLILVVIVFGIAFGVVTPTESAALATGLALVLGFGLYRETTLSQIPKILTRTALNSALVLFLIATAKLFGWILTFNQIPASIAGMLRALTDDPTVFLLLVLMTAVVIGAILDGIAALIIVVPILLPIATSDYGIDPIHFGVVICMTLTIGLLTPPVGTGLYIACAVARLPFLALVREIVPFVAATMLVVIIVAVFEPMVGFLGKL